MLPAPHADLYAIIKTTEKLERAYVRDAISPQEYEQACDRLIAQFKVLWGSLQSSVSLNQCMRTCMYAETEHHCTGSFPLKA